MRRIVFIIVGLFAVFTMIRAYAATKQTASAPEDETRTEQVNYADTGASAESSTENL
jgi:preprotein translocase subunit SecG